MIQIICYSYKVPCLKTRFEKDIWLFSLEKTDETIDSDFATKLYPMNYNNTLVSDARNKYLITENTSFQYINPNIMLRFASVIYKYIHSLFDILEGQPATWFVK